MNRALTDMLHCMNTPENIAGNDSGMTVMERQLARLKWQIQQSGNSQQSYFNETQFNILPITDPTTESHQFQGLINTEFAIPIRDLANQSMKADPGFENGWSNLGKSLLPRTEFVGEKTRFLSPDMDYPLSRTASCPQAVVVTGSPPEKMTSTVGRESFKKRKSTKAQNSKVNSGEAMREKKMKGDVEEVESKVTEENNNNNREASCDTSKEDSKASEVQKLDYIHVRARRGQATDSHSLAERVRREKISERMKYLQDLVPGCNKITGKAGMLDEIINYVQSLQRQVEFLSMKLATVNPRLDFNIDNFLTKEVFQACTGEFPAIGISPEMVNPAYLQLNPVQQIISCCGLDMNINPSDDMALRRTTSAPVSVPETFLDSSCFPSQPTSSNWENDLQNLYNVDFHQGRSNIFPFQPFTGTMEDNNLKMEM